MITMNLDEYYKDPLIESFIYVSMGMDSLKERDPEIYNQIRRKQTALTKETEEALKDARHISDKLGLPRLEVDRYIDEFLQRFPLGIREFAAWDDIKFIFLYILTRLLKPKIIIETGCSIGFSSTFTALAVKENNNGCRFYTMDILDNFRWENIPFVSYNDIKNQKINFEKLKTLPPPQALSMVPADLREYIIFLKGSSKDILPGLLKENKDVDIFFHDSEHSYRNIVWESMAVLPYIKKGGYLLVHDADLSSAFSDMFANRGGLVVGISLGVYKKEESGFPPVIKHLSLPSENSQRNDEEFRNKKIKLDSFPKTAIVQTSSYCTLDCISCPMDNQSEIFNPENFLYKFRQVLEGGISFCLSQVELFVIKLCGNFVQLSDWKFMRKFMESFPEAERIFYVHGEYLTTQICALLASGLGRYHYQSKNIIQVVLPASNSYIYKSLTGSENFQKVFDRIKYLIHRRSEDHIKIHFVFPVTTFNIEDLPDFVRMAVDMGVDKIICDYSSIKIPEQKYLSCFFKQELTNKIFDDAEALADNLGIRIELPPRFNQKIYPAPDICRKPFSQIIFDSQGHLFPCDPLEDCAEVLTGEKGFMDVWNSQYYQQLRKSLLERNASCFKHCFRANPSAVNDFRSHVIHRERDF